MKNTIKLKELEKIENIIGKSNRIDLTIAETSKYSGITVGKIRTLIKKRLIDFYCKKRKIYINHYELQRIEDDSIKIPRKKRKKKEKRIKRTNKRYKEI